MNHGAIGLVPPSAHISAVIVLSLETRGPIYKISYDELTTVLR